MYIKFIKLLIFLNFIISISHAQSLLDCQEKLLENNIVLAKGDTFMGTSNFISPESFNLDSNMYEELESIKNLFLQDGVSLILVPIPTHPMVYYEALDKTDPFQSNWDYEGTVNKYYQFIDNIKQKSIKIVDVYRVLNYGWDYSWSSQQVPYLHQERHWTPLGAQLAASAVANEIKTDNAYQNLEKTLFVNQQDGIVSRWEGNEWLKKVESLCDVPISGETVTKWTTTETNPSSLGLFDDLSYSIAYIGSSYGAELFNFSGFLAEASQLKVVNYSVSAGGMFGSLYSYLKNEYSEKKPNYIVWEFPFLDLAGSEPTTGNKDDIYSNLLQISALLSSKNCADPVSEFNSTIGIDTSNIDFTKNLISASNDFSSNLWRKGPGINLARLSSNNASNSKSPFNITMSEKGGFMLYDLETSLPLGERTFLFSSWISSESPENVEIIRFNALTQPSKNNFFQMRLESISSIPQLYTGVLQVPSATMDSIITVGITGNGNYDFFMYGASLIEITNEFIVLNNLSLEDKTQRVFEISLEDKGLKKFNIVIKFKDSTLTTIPFTISERIDNDGIFYLNMKEFNKEIQTLSLLPNDLGNIPNKFNVSIHVCKTM